MTDLPEYRAHVAGNPALSAYLYQDPPGPYSRVERSADGASSIVERGIAPGGWRFMVQAELPGGDSKTLRDVYEETYARILNYLEEFVPRGVPWRCQRTGEIVDVYSLDFHGLA